MGAFVSNQDLGAGEGLAADVAGVGLFPRVRPHVPLDGAGCDGFAANFAYVHADAFVSRVLSLVNLVRPPGHFLHANGTFHLPLGGIVGEGV